MSIGSNNYVRLNDLNQYVLLTIIIYMLVFSVPSVIAGSNQPNANFEIAAFNGEKIQNKSKCSSGNSTFEIVLTSPSGEEVEDDTTLWFVNSGKAVNANPGKPGYIAFLKPQKDSSICENAAAYKLLGDKIAIPLFLSNRPDLDLLAVAVYDPNDNEVLKYTVLKRYYGDTPSLKAIEKGFSYLAVSSQPNDTSKGMVETWMNITWNGKDSVQKWDHSYAEIRH